jgi:ribosomal protein S18
MCCRKTCRKICRYNTAPIAEEPFNFIDLRMLVSYVTDLATVLPS